MESDQLKLLARGVVPIDEAVASDGSYGLRIFVDAPEAIPAVASVLTRARDTSGPRGCGPISFCLMDAALPGEVDIALAEPYPVTPQIKGALKSLGGVVTVEEI